MNELTSTEALSVLRITTEEGESFRLFHVFFFLVDASRHTQLLPLVDQIHQR